MVRFSCFSTPPLNQRPKKDQRYRSDVPSTSQQNNEDGTSNMKGDDISNSFSQGELWKLEYLNSDSHERVIGEDVSKMKSIKRSQSLGCVLDNQSSDLLCVNDESSSIGNDSHEPLFSIEFLKQSDAQSNEFDNYPAAFTRSQSTSNFMVDSDNFVEGDEDIDLKHRSRSFQNLASLHDDDYESGNDNENMKNIEKCDDVDEDKYSQIEAWISRIHVEEECTAREEEEEASESSFSFPRQETEAEVVAVTPNIKPGSGVRSKLGTEVAYNYISSLNAASTSAQIVNLGLVSVPFLSPFNSLRVVNLSGNNIVKINSGCLPKGLHMLNLSKNNISVIEGLRDLARLRVLDLSFNRIVRIGHGLASCTSIKELFLAGNKISDIEGLHRLRKLTTLDLAKNKISTAKGLGQLASNYASLQAINVEGNPAQKTVGDEQLKRYLISLLPNLVHYNKHAIKTTGGGARDVSDRSSTRSVARNDNNSKIPRRGSHGSGIHKLGLVNQSAKSSHGVQSLLKQSRNRNVLRLPFVGGGSKPAKYVPEVEKKPVSLQSSSTIRRSRSEGTL